MGQYLRKQEICPIMEDNRSYIRFQSNQLEENSFQIRWDRDIVIKDMTYEGSK